MASHESSLREVIAHISSSLIHIFDHRGEVGGLEFLACGICDLLLCRYGVNRLVRLHNIFLVATVIQVTLCHLL